MLNPIKHGDFNVIFGGQYDVIQRVVNGIDSSSFWAIRERAVGILNDYFDEVQAYVHSINPAIDIPKPKGKIHVGLLTKNAPELRWISEEGFTFEHKHIPKFQHA